MLTYTNDPLTISNRLSRAIKDISPGIYTMLLVTGHKAGKGDYLDISSKGHISYRPLNRIVDGEDPYAIKGRVSGKPAKVLKSFLGQLIMERPEIDLTTVSGNLDESDYPYNMPHLWDRYQNYNITDVTWEHFSNMFVAQNKEVDSEKIKIVTGDDIKKYYHEREHTRTSRPTPLLSSCMKYDFCQPYLDIYAKNPEVCSMMVEFDEENKVRARALIWKTVRGQIYMDRIYGDNKSVAFFRNYATEQGWWFKEQNTYTAPCQVNVDGKKSTRRMRVKLDFIPDEFPYMDTMLYLSKEKMELSNSRASLKNSRDLSELRSTRGGSRALRRPPLIDETSIPNRFDETAPDNVEPEQESMGFFEGWGIGPRTTNRERGPDRLVHHSTGNHINHHSDYFHELIDRTRRVGESTAQLGESLERTRQEVLELYRNSDDGDNEETSSRYLPSPF